MRQFTSRAARASPARRRTVRIVKQRSGTRTAVISLLSVALPALLSFLVWQYWEKEEDVPVLRRRPEDVVLDWKCERRHTFQARGQAAPRKCPTCGKPAYTVGTYLCLIHGTFELVIRYVRDSAGITRPSEYRIAGREWVSASNGARCPHCDRTLQRKPKDPFAHKPRRKQRGGR